MDKNTELSDEASFKAGEALGKLLGVSERRPKTIGDWYDLQDGTAQELAGHWRVDGYPCMGGNGCGGADGVLVAVANQRNEETGIGFPDGARILMVSFSHHQGATIAAISIEQAKEFANRIGDAVRLAEQVSAASEGN